MRKVVAGGAGWVQVPCRSDHQGGRTLWEAQPGHATRGIDGCRWMVRSVCEGWKYLLPSYYLRITYSHPYTSLRPHSVFDGWMDVTHVT
jgi:hypothetical protein